MWASGWRSTGEGNKDPASCLIAVSCPGAHPDLMDGRADLPRIGSVQVGSSASLPCVVVSGP